MKRCLVVVDYQNDFVDGSLGFDGAKLLDDIIVNKINEYLNAKDDLIFTFDTHFDNYLETKEGSILPIYHCIKGTLGHNLYGKVASFLDKATKVFEKETFGSLKLGQFLKDQQYDVVELCGLVTNMCVLSNAVITKAALPNAKIIVDRRTVASFDLKLHNETLDVLKGIHIDIE